MAGVKGHLWNGFFCAISLTYARKGYGSETSRQTWKILLEKSKPQGGQIDSESACDDDRALLRGFRTPCVLAITHSNNAAKFHQKNGFEPFDQMEYRDASCSSMDVIVLVKSLVESNPPSKMTSMVEEDIHLRLLKRWRRRRRHKSRQRRRVFIHHFSCRFSLYCFSLSFG